MFKRRKSIAAPSFMVQDESVVIKAATTVDELLEVLDKNSNPLFTVQHDGDVLIGQQVAATQSYVDTAISNLVDAAPAALNTLNELAAALNDDSNFSGTVTTALSGKAPLESPALTGTPTAPTATLGTDTTQIATTAFVQDAITAYSGTLDGLSDVVITSPAEFQSLTYNGVNWVNSHASTVTYVRNAEATTLTTGTVVYLFGATGDHATVKRADNDSDTTSSKTVGLVAAPIAASENGPVVTRGYVDGIDLSVGYTPGDVLWLGEDGTFTTTKPTAPEHLVFIGVVVRATNNGIVYVATQNGYELDELHDVSLPSPASGQFLKYDGSLWVADSIDLGTDTTGNYISDVTAGTGISVSHTPGEGSSPTISNSGVTSVAGTTDQISVSSSTGSTTISLPTNIYVSGRAAIGSSGRAGMPSGSLEIGNTTTNYYYSSGWPTTPGAGILANCSDRFELVVHDAATRLASPIYYEGESNNIYMGRDLGWGATRIVKTGQPAFLAYNLGNYFNGAHQLIYGGTTFNVGSHYNTSTYTFTAPVSGMYLFCLNINVYSANGATVMAVILKNGGTYINGERKVVNTTGDFNINANAIVYLAKDDTAAGYLYASTNVGLSGGQVWNSLGGYFLG